jgi:saccharopine dehydrogenase-like NADP-dependent oxidoreductase
MSSKPVVVYGASGYTGRLICEYLRELNLPFVAAGRDKGRLQAGLDTVPGLETAEYEIAEVAHSVAELTKLLAGAKVLCNTVGPFMEYGPAAVEACYNAGVHYTDTTGEQDWLIWCKENWGAKFAEKGLLLTPGIAQMYTVGEIAANYVLETPGIDSLDMAVFWKGTPTVASTATIVQNAILSKAYYLEENKLVEWPADVGLYELTVPGQHELGLALPWGGTSSPIWFQDDPRVSTCKVLGGVIDRR